MIIGFFDSGIGGLEVMWAFQEEFGEMEMIFECDREHCPFGNLSRDEIRAYTKAGVERLFARGADVVILACNTASVHALRWFQQEVFVGKHILGVTIPGAEKVTEMGYRKIGVLATEATVRIRAYKERVHILDDSVIVEEVGAPGLVPLIEQGRVDGEELEWLLREYLSQFSPDIEALVLGCTHYPIIQGVIEKVWDDLYHKKSPDIIDPGKEAVRKFRGWLMRHWAHY